MKLQIGCKIVVEAAEDCPAVAILRPRSGQAQWLHSERHQFEPQVNLTEYVDSFGNLCQRMVIPQGQMTIQVDAEVETEAVIRVEPNAPATPPEFLPDDTLQFMLPSRYCPSDKTGSLPFDIAGPLPPGYAQVAAIQDWINRNINYQYGQSNVSTDALDTVAHGAGVCRDFAHIGITCCRALRIPARMVVGYLHRLDPMDLHAWFEAYIDGHWYTFDPTQNEPRGGRVVLAYGRDAADVAFLTNYGPLQTTQMSVYVNDITEQDATQQA